MLHFHLILCLSVAILAAQAELFYSDPLSSNAFLGPEQPNNGNGFEDVYQPLDSSSSDVDINLDVFVSSDSGSNDPTLFADVPNNTCLSSFSSPLAFGKARGRRNNNPAGCSPGEGEIPQTEIPNLSPGSVEGALAQPTEYEQKTCTNGGSFKAVAFLVCRSLSGFDTRKDMSGASILYHSTRGIFSSSPGKFVGRCVPCQICLC